MPLNKRHGNMYPWVTHTWNPIRGHCPHECVYCYMRGLPVFHKRLRLVYKELKRNLGEGRVIFIGSSTDMWAWRVNPDWIQSVLEYIAAYPKNVYLFQTKNPRRYYHFKDSLKADNVILGTTIETNRTMHLYSQAPPPSERASWLSRMAELGYKTMVSIEPVVECDVPVLARLVYGCQPEFVSIGADSKGHGLPEPSPWQLEALIGACSRFTEVRPKDNLKRLYKGGKNATTEPVS